MPDYHSLLVAMTATNQRQGAMLHLYERFFEKNRKALEGLGLEAPKLPAAWVHPCEWRPTGAPSTNPKHDTPKWEEQAALAIMRSVLDFWPMDARELPEVKSLYVALDAPGWLVSSIMPRLIKAVQALEAAESVS